MDKQDTTTKQGRARPGASCVSSPQHIPKKEKGLRRNPLKTYEDTPSALKSSDANLSSNRASDKVNNDASGGSVTIPGAMHVITSEETYSSPKTQKGLRENVPAARPTEQPSRKPNVPSFKRGLRNKVKTRIGLGKTRNSSDEAWRENGRNTTPAAGLSTLLPVAPQTQKTRKGLRYNDSVTNSVPVLVDATDARNNLTNNGIKYGLRRSNPNVRQGAVDSDATSAQNNLWQQGTTESISGTNSTGLQAVEDEFSIENGQTTGAASMAINGQVVAQAVTRHDLEEEIEQRIIAQATVGEVVEVNVFDAKSPEDIRRERCKIALVVAVLVALAIFWSAFFATRNKEEDKPLVNADKLQAFLVTASLSAFETSNAAGLQLAIPGSPQKQAMDWLATNLESFPVKNAAQEQHILETYALATLFFTTGGNETWDASDLESWMVGADACIWLRDPDTDCTQDGLVERLTLAQANMTYTLPDELLFLTELEELDVADNSLTGSLPTSIPNSIQILKLSNNLFEGEIPTQMAKLKNLTLLCLTQNNRLRASLPDDILSSWTNLETLRLDETPIHGTIPTIIGMMTSLKEFSAQVVNLSGEIPSQIGLCTSLQTFHIPQYSDLSSNISGFLPEEFWTIPSLESIDLQYVGLAFTIPGEHMEHLSSSLKNINFGTTRIQGTLPTQIGHLSNLESLELDNGVMLGGTIPSQIGAMKSLKVLDLSRDPVMFGGLPTQVGNLAHLERLWIFSSSSFNETMIPSEIARCSKLQSLFLKGSEKATGSIPTEIGLLLDLVELELLMTSVTGSIPSQMGLLRKFEILTIGGPGITGTLPTELAMAASLAKLLVAGTQIGGTIPPQYGSLENMDKLALSNNKLAGTLPVTLSALNKLDWFSVNGNDITGTIPFDYSNWHNVLGHVMIWDTDIGGELGTAICNGWGEENEVQADCEEVSCDSCCTHCCVDGECSAVNGEDDEKPGRGNKSPSFYPPIRTRSRIRGRA